MSQPPPTRGGKSREDIARAYQSEPWWYDLRGFFILTFAYNSSILSQLRHFGRNFGPRHLELACGTGTLLELILYWRRWHKLKQVDIIGVDYAESMLAGAKHRFRKASRISFQHADAACMPFADECFDTINIANAVHCFPEVLPALLDARRVLKSGGMLAANVLLFPSGSGVLGAIANKINSWGMRKGILVTPYQKSAVRDLFLRAGFVVISEEVSGNCFNILLRRP